MTTAEYTYGNALVRKDGEYPFFDRMGNERLITNSSQTITAGNIVQDAFGEMVRAPGSSTSAYQYGATSGYRTDGDAGLMLVGARYYDPQVGRFLTRDTMLTELPYVYCDGDPVNGVDPSGHVSAGRILKYIGAGIGVALSALSGITLWQHAEQTWTKNDGIANMRTMENNFEKNHGPETDTSKFRQLIRDAQVSAADSAGETATDAGNTIYGSMPK